MPASSVWSGTQWEIKLPPSTLGESVSMVSAICQRAGALSESDSTEVWGFRAFLPTILLALLSIWPLHTGV